MNSLSVCLLLFWAAEPAQTPTAAIYQPHPQFAAAIRGQSPSPAYDPFGAGPILEAPVPMSPGMQYGSPGVQYNSPMGMPPADPFIPGTDFFGGDPALSPMSPGPMGPLFAGVNGPQPYRFGLIPKLELAYVPQANIPDFDSNVEMFELNTELRHNSPFAQGWIFSSAPQFDYRAWNTGGPLGDLGRMNLYRFGWDLELLKLKANGWTLDFDFNPSINTDTEHNTTSNAWNFDTRIAATYQIDQAWMLVLGVQYWDRVDDVIIPHAGVVYTPDDLWEFRLLFPKARISRFLGNFWGGHHWLYLSNEYNVEAYQADLSAIGSSASNRVQYEEWSAALGLRSDHVWFDKFIEIAWLYDRNFEFEEDIPKFSTDDQLMIRGGIRF